MADFLLYALLAGLALAIVAGPLGSFVVWRRMAYFGDTLSHAALLGVAMGFLLDISPTIAVTVGCLLLAVLLVTLQQRQSLASDTLLGILAPSTLSLGLVVLSFMHEVRIDLMAYLFGDLLAISPTDLMWILGGSAAVLALLVALWRPLLAITVHEELATVEGLPVAALRLTLMLLIAVVIAVAMKIVGVLLITSLLIIPAAAAQRHARSPEQMALGASALGILAVLLVTLQQRQSLASDTLLGILAPSTLSLGLVVLSFMHEVRIDLMAYLFGDLLAISPNDLMWILGGSAAVLVLLVALWRPLLAITVHEELAMVEGLPVAALRLTLMLLIAVVIAVAMKIVGVLLITSLLIIPAAAAQRHARSPEQMALGASALGILAVCGGLALSWFKDTPAGPSIVVCAAALFLLSFVLPRRGV